MPRSSSNAGQLRRIVNGVLVLDQIAVNGVK